MGLSPMMQHYVETKEKYKDCILMYRLGDFYEMFFDDAVTVSREMEITLTSRDCGMTERAPMCGVPYHAVDSYLARLIAKGYKVAICEQMTPPGQNKLVEREVVRVVTAGTVTEPEMLDEKSNNFLAAVFYSDERIGLAWCDISTGEFNLNQFEAQALTKLSDAMIRIRPSEIICNEPCLSISFDLPCVISLQVPKFSMYNNASWEYCSAKNSLKGFLEKEIEQKKYAVCAAGALVGYISEMQKHAVENLERIELEDENAFMYLDAATRRNLELTTPLLAAHGSKGTLLWLLDKTVTSMGKRRLRSWIESPLLNQKSIIDRQDCVEELTKSSVELASIRAALSSVYDLERLASKVAYKSVNPKDLAAIRDTLTAVPLVKAAISTFKSTGLRQLNSEIDTMDDICAMLTSSIVTQPPHTTKDGGFICDNYSAELKELKDIESNSGQWLAALEATEKEATGIRNLRTGYTRVFGYYIEVSKGQTQLVPYRYQRKQTTVNSERYITAELKELEEKILGGKERALEIELAIFVEVCNQLKQNISRMLSTARSLAVMDCLVSLASVAKEYAYVRPTIFDDGIIDIKDGRHPTIERLTESLFVPNDTVLDSSDNRIMIITGPNMAGKSTYMRQVALIVIMAHIGSFVPAKSAHIALTDRVFTRIGASDDLISGHSTFMVEMLEVANIMDHATSKSLILLDEIGRGTSTYDGLSIAWAVMEYLASDLKAKSLFSTHFHELTELEQRLDGVKNYRVSVRELGGSIVFLHKIARGSVMRSYGIEVASIAGLNAGVVKRAQEILKHLQDNDINNNVANEVMTKQSNMFETASLKGFSEVKDILTGLDFDHMTPLKALEVLVDLCERVKN